MILVTGANGLLGSHVCNVLHSGNFPFKAMVRKSSDLTLLRNIPEEVIVKGDILDVLGLEAALSGIDTVINCAGLVSFNKKDKEALYMTNVVGTRMLVNACIPSGVRKFIHVSSIAALGRNKKNSLVGENTKWENSKLNTEYAKSKYLGELEVWRASCEGLCVNIVNPSIILAPYLWERSSSQVLHYIKDGFPFYPMGNINYVDLRDVTEIILKLYQGNIKNERFIINGGSLPYKAFFEKAARRFHTKPPVIKLSKPLAWLGWALESFRSALSGKPAMVTQETTMLSFSKSRYDNGKSFSLLNHHYRSLENTLDWACMNPISKRSRAIEPNYQPRKIL